MCGRFVAMLSPEQLSDFFKLLNVPDVAPRYNIAPTQPVAAIWEAVGRRERHLARWGLVPGWAKDPRQFPLLVNARIEGIADKPAFRAALKHGRCIIPASGYYEWRSGPDKKKQPYYITLTNGQPMALAGLYTTWSGPQGEAVDTVATITVPANSDLAAIHDRMPAILIGEAIDRWLDVRTVRAKEAAQLALPLEPGAVKFHPVSTRVNSAREDNASLIVPVTIGQPEPVARKARTAQLDLF